MIRTLKYAILGLICQKPVTGYDITQEFQTTLSEFWTAKHSQIYPELKKLTEEGLITYDVEISGTVLEKKVYHITEAGQKEFAKWLEQDVPMQPTAKDVFRLRMYFSGQLPRDIREKLLKSQLEQHRKRLAHLKKNQEKFNQIPAPDDPEIGDYMVLMGGVMREETTVEWLKQCLEITVRKS